MGNQGRQPPRRRPPVSDEQYEEYLFIKKQAARKRRRRKRQIVSLVFVALVIVSIFAIKMAFDLGAGADTFYEGVLVDGLPLKGLSKEEAVDKLTMMNASRINNLTVHLSYEGREWSIPPEQFGADIDIEDKVEEAWALGHEGNIFARQREIGRLKRENVALSTTITYDHQALRSKLEQVKKDIDTPAVDATITFDPSKEERFRITQEKNGRQVNVDTLFNQVEAQLNNGFTVAIEVKADVVAPKILAETLEQSKEKIVRTTTDLGSSSDARIHNVKTALAYFNGMIVQPGEEVSFNRTTGPRDYDQGYQDAGVILDDEIVQGAGGGVCQVSTTLYQAVVKAGLEVVRSNKHSMVVSYVDPGTDAAVAYDYKDLVFKNNTDFPIFIEGKVSGKTVVVTIYGHPLEEGTTYEIVSEVYEKIPAPDPKVELDKTGTYATYTDEIVEKKKSREGIKVKSYQVKKVDGKEVSRELLRNDYYKEVQGVSYQGVTPREAGEGGGDTNPPREDNQEE